MRVFGIDPGSERTGYGCVETDGRVARLVVCGAIKIGIVGHRRYLTRFEIQRYISTLLK